MMEFLLIAIAGALGSAHCVGMCGGFVITLGSAAPSWRANVIRQCIFGLGRLSTYTALGAAAGYGGHKLILALPLTNSQAWLALLAGTLLLIQGLAATGWIRWRRSAARNKPACISSGVLSTLLRSRAPAAALSAGVLTGLLPCGLVCSFLALAAGSGSMVRGLAAMAAFGIGTLPLLTLLGLGTSLLGMVIRQRLIKAAAWCVVVTGIISIARGATALQPVRETNAAPTCPLCSTRDQELLLRIDSAAQATTAPATESSTTNKPTP